MSRRRRGALSAEEQALWEHVARTITPLRPLPEEGAVVAVAEAEAPPPAPPAPVVSLPKAKPVLPGQKPLAPIERRLRTRIARGSSPLAARLDLHGLTQQSAHLRLRRFLSECQADEIKLALVITGKGAGKGAGASEERWGGEGRGVLHRQVPLWLASPEFRDLVVGFEEAHAAHGGRGALYVRLRRGKPRRV